jgi:hypothetical protein
MSFLIVLRRCTRFSIHAFPSRVSLERVLRQGAHGELEELLAELKRRNLCNVAIAYGVVTWLLMQKFAIMLIKRVFVRRVCRVFPILGDGKSGHCARICARVGRI